MINTFSCSAVLCLLILTSTKFWRYVVWHDVVWHDVTSSRHMVSILPFLDLIVKIEFVVVNCMYVYNKNIITIVTWSDGSDHVSYVIRSRRNDDHGRPWSPRFLMVFDDF